VDENTIENPLSTENLCSALLDSIRGVIWECDPATFRFYYVSPHAETLLGYPSQRWTGEADFWLAHTPPDDVERSVRICREALAKLEDPVFEQRLIGADDREVWVQNIVTVVRRDDGSVRLRGITIDIGERKALERALEKSEEQFRSLCALAPIGIFRANSAGNCVYANPAMEKITGIAGSAWSNRSLTLAVHPEDREALAERWLEAKVRGGFYSHECRIVVSHDETRWVRILGNPVQDSDGTLTGYVGTVEDITDLRQARHEILKNQKMESLGVLAGGIAHDFNNLLTVMLGNISLAQMQLHDAGQVGKRLEDAEQAAGRAKELAQQLLTFAKGGEPVKRPLEVAGLLRESLDAVPADGKTSCELRLPEGLWPVEADLGQIRQVIQNLVLNAIQAMPAGETVTIAAENVSSRQGGKRFVKFSVADTASEFHSSTCKRSSIPTSPPSREGAALGLPPATRSSRSTAARSGPPRGLEPAAPFTSPSPPRKRSLPFRLPHTRRITRSISSSWRTRSR
jgi:PAS domain S-box-containing protein